MPIKMTSFNTNSRTVDEVIDTALDRNSSQEGFEEALSALRYSKTDEVFEKAEALCKSDKPQARTLGVQILGQLGESERTFCHQSCKVLMDLLMHETSVDVLAAIGWGLGHLNVDFPLEQLIVLKSTTILKCEEVW